VSPAEEGDRLAGALRAAVAVADPLERYGALTKVQQELDALVSGVKVARGQALDELRPGATWAEIAELAGLGTYQRAQQLINAARAARERTS